MTTTFPIHDIESAPADAKPILAAASKAIGFVPNLYGVFASSPAVLEAYTALAQLLDSKTDFDETERQVLFLTISARNECEYCVAAHSVIAGAKRVPQAVVDAVRDGTPLANAKLEALRTFASAVVEQRGLVGQEALDAFFGAGYSPRHALEVILAVAFKTLSNTTNHLAATPLDRAFQARAWSAGAAV